MDFKLGNNFSEPDDRDIEYDKYAHADTAVGTVNVPATFGHGNSFSNWGMLGNDDYGDCVLAGSDHETMLINNLAQGDKVGYEAVKFTAENALDDYGAITGFNPKTGAGDNGTEPRDAFKYRQKTGLIDARGSRHKIAAYVSIPVTNIKDVLEAVFIFDAVGIGIEFPGSAMEQFNSGQPWDVVEGAQIEGGHYIPIVGRPAAEQYAIITWGKRQLMTEAFYQKYTQEAWGFITEESLNVKTKENWGGFNWAALQADLQKV